MTDRAAFAVYLSGRDHSALPSYASTNSGCHSMSGKNVFLIMRRPGMIMHTGRLITSRRSMSAGGGIMVFCGSPMIILRE